MLVEIIHPRKFNELRLFLSRPTKSICPGDHERTSVAVMRPIVPSPMIKTFTPDFGFALNKPVITTAAGSTSAADSLETEGSIL